MYKLSEHEHDTLYKAMTDLLDEYDYSYNKSALEKIIDTWASNKATLINAFQKHPNYVDGKFMIAFERDYERTIDKTEIATFGNYLENLVFDNTCHYNLPETILTECKKYDRRLPPTMFNFFWNNHINRYYSRTVTEDFANTVSNAFPDIPCHVGEKTTRLINRICTYLNWHKHPDYNRMYARYADALSPIVIKRHTIFSINPLDYLTMSFGNSWASCHTIDKENKRNMPNAYEGQYSSGTMSYLLDGTSIVMYTVDKEYNGTDYYTQPKVTRIMFHYGNEKLIQGRLYPQDNDGNTEVYTPYRLLAQEIIATIFDFPNLWTTKNYDSISANVNSYGTHYKDYYYCSNCKLSVVRDSEDTEPIDIGHTPICIECGSKHDCEENINCCRNGYCCADCGCYVNEDDGYWVNGEFYCEDCVTYCDCCGEYERNDNTRYIEGYGEVCDDCVEEYFYNCDDCDELVHRDNVVKITVDGYTRWICDDCFDEYRLCLDCDTYHRIDDMEEIDGDYYCQECYDKRTEETEDTEESED